MGDEILTPVPSNTSEPLSKKWGITGDYTLHLPVSTSVSESGIGHTPALNLHIAESFDDRYVLRLQFPFSNTTSKLTPSTSSEGTTREHSTWAVEAGIGHISRRYAHFNDNGDFTSALNITTFNLIGRGTSTLIRPARNVLGEEFPSAEESASTWNIGTRYTFTGEFRPGGGRGPVLEIGPGLYSGVQYAGKDSSHNRLRLDLLITAGIGYGDGSTTSGADSDTELGPLGIGHGFGTMFLEGVQRYATNNTLSTPMQALAEYNLTGDPSAQPDSTTDINFLKAGAAFSSGMGSPLAAPLRAGSGWMAAFTAMRIIRGGIFAANGGTESAAGAITDFMGGAELIGYAIAGIEEPDKRLSLPQDEVRRRKMYVAIPIYVISSLLMAGGAADNSEAFMRGGSNAGVHLALSPDPLDRGMVERTDIQFIPHSLYYGSKDGSRGGVRVHSSWNDEPSEDIQFYSAATFVSPKMKPGNIANMPSQSQPDSDAGLSSDICASLGIEYKPTWVRLSIGPMTCGIFASGVSAPKAGIGGTAGFDLTLPFNGKDDGSGLSLGVHVDAIKPLPDGSANVEAQPVIGISLHE